MGIREPFLFKIIPWFIGITFVLIIVYYVLIAVVAGKAIVAVEEECKDGFAKCLGRQVKQFNDGVEGK